MALPRELRLSCLPSMSPTVLTTNESSVLLQMRTAKCKVKRWYVFNELVLPYDHLIAIFIQVVTLMTNCLVQAYFVIAFYP